MPTLSRMSSRNSSADAGFRTILDRLVIGLLLAAVLLTAWIGSDYVRHPPSTWNSRMTTTNHNNNHGPAIPADAMAACLILFDDNLSLTEWLAYHYHVMPLRHVIVLTDPRSTESPVPILERWSGFLTYELWEESRVFAHDPERLQELRAAGDLVQLHRARQGHFYGQCMKELKERGKHNDHDQWLVLTDVDEYITINPRVAEQSHKLYRPHQTFNLTESGSVLTFLQQEKKEPPACLHMARRDMVSKESSLEKINAGVPDFLDATAFFTTRWRHQSQRRITGKALVNLAAIRYTDIPIQTPRQGHVPLQRYCPSWRAKYRYDMENTPLVVHHYLGTQAQYQHRDEGRRDRTDAGFENKQNQPTTVQDSVRSWLAGFVESVGRERAAQLLAGAGHLGVDER